MIPLPSKNDNYFHFQNNCNKSLRILFSTEITQLLYQTYSKSQAFVAFRQIILTFSHFCVNCLCKPSPLDIGRNQKKKTTSCVKKVTFVYIISLQALLWFPPAFSLLCKQHSGKSPGIRLFTSPWGLTISRIYDKFFV